MTIKNRISKTILDDLVKKYETKDFIQEDPIQFAHKGLSKTDKELMGFIASLFAYGNRKIFIKFLNKLFESTQQEITNYIKNGDFNNLRGLEYRFSKDYDIIPIFEILHILYNESSGLEELFAYSYKQNNSQELNLHFFQYIIDYFYIRAPKHASQGFYHMLPNPQNQGAMKRMNMFLRWMIRKSEVDLGIWNFITPANLLIPLDVHVSRISRNMGLLNRKSNDFKAVLELTNNLKKYCPEDPIKYDFAMFAFGVELNSIKAEV